MLPYQMRRDKLMYKQVLEIAKDERWCKDMLRKQKEELLEKQIKKIETGKQ